MSFKRSLIKHDNLAELRVTNKQGTVLYALLILEYGTGDLQSSLVGIRGINFKLTNRAFRYEMSRLSNMPLDLLENDSEEDLFEIV